MRSARPILALTLAAAWLAGLAWAPCARASRIKDITLIEGDRDNQLVGYGLVVGLAGAGDSNPQATLHSVANVLQHYGITVNPQQDVTAKNTAAVMVTADISAFLKAGARIDVTVASMGDAKSLQGGVLLQTPLLGADGRTYAVAQGAIALGGYLGGQGGSGGATVQRNHPTVGTMSNGAIVEREIPAQFVHNGFLRLLLHNPDFTSAARMADAVNGHWPRAAVALDSATVKVTMPPAYTTREVSFISDLGLIEVRPDTGARVVINERTGTIVATAPVRISQVAIADGSLTITVTSNLKVSQPAPFSSGGTTKTVPTTQTNVNESKGSLLVLDEEPTIEQLAAALNALGVSTREMMTIFQTLKRAGALQADLIIN
jgi:flagellar P-ring protein precursor FlgI